jgi:hypothetical protein
MADGGEFLTSLLRTHAAIAFPYQSRNKRKADIERFVQAPGRAGVCEKNESDL